jgi:hypothetical protein
LAIGCGGFCFYNLREFGLLFANSQIYHEALPIVASRCVIKISSTWDLSGNRRVLAEVLKWEAKFRGFGPKVIVDVKYGGLQNRRRNLEFFEEIAAALNRSSTQLHELWLQLHVWDLDSMEAPVCYSSELLNVRTTNIKLYIKYWTTQFTWDQRDEDNFLEKWKETIEEAKPQSEVRYPPRHASECCLTQLWSRFEFTSIQWRSTQKRRRANPGSHLVAS